MKSVAEGHDTRAIDLFKDFGVSLMHLPLVVAGHTDVHKVLGNLVRVLAWRRNLDRTSPVEVVVAQRIRQVL